jgi:hypothetical protein
MAVHMPERAARIDRGKSVHFHRNRPLPGASHAEAPAPQPSRAARKALGKGGQYAPSVMEHTGEETSPFGFVCWQVFEKSYTCVYDRGAA